MKIYSVTDPAFQPYGQMVTGLDKTVCEMMIALANTPLPEGIGYVPEDPALQRLPAAIEISEHLYGGMPVQLGWCNGHNTKLNCLEYHRDSESTWAQRTLSCCWQSRRRWRTVGWTPGRSGHSGCLPEHWWKSTPLPCTTLPVMCTGQRAFGFWWLCARGSTGQSRRSRQKPQKTGSSGHATSGCWPA